MIVRVDTWRNALSDWRAVRPSPTQRSLAESLTGLAAIITGTMLPFYGPLPEALADWPWLLQGLRLVVPFAGTAACISIFVSTTRASKGGGRQFRFPTSDRLLAGLLVLPLFVVSFAEATEVLPTAGFTVMAGYVCDASGVPLIGAVSILDRTKHNISVERVKLEETGYFATVLARWSPRPAFIQANGICKSRPIPIGDSAVGEACPANSIEPPPRGVSKIWSLSCL
jgi:hypothetical protein